METEKKSYETPTIRSVSFVIEHGFAMSGGTDNYSRSNDRWFDGFNAETDGNADADGYQREESNWNWSTL